MTIQKEITDELYLELKETIQGEVRFDNLSRQLYSTDASCYRIVPTGVVIPRHTEDVLAAMEIAKQRGASLVPRGSGSSLAGQTVGPGVVIDCSRWLDKILAINTNEKWAQVEAGVTLDQLNAALLPHNLMVGPNPASSQVATLGGMAANNSTGSHSIVYGLMIDHVTEMDVALSDGQRCKLEPKTAAQIAFLAEKTDLEGQLYRQIPGLLDEFRAEIKNGYPHVWRNVAGYPLNRLLADLDAGRLLNLSSLMIGSEGTLGMILDLKVNLVDRPAFTHLTVLQFNELRTALELVPEILEWKPSAVELLSHFVMNQARAHPAFRPRLERFVQGNPQALLVVEFSGNSPELLASQARQFEQQQIKNGNRYSIVHCSTPEEIENVWTVRREVNGLLLSRPGDVRPLPFVDDAAVPLDQLADFVGEAQAACRELGVEVNFDAHASAGCLHMNPAINLKTPIGLQKMQDISKTVMEIAIRHGGTTTGEHGEGLARSLYNQPLYGPRLHQAFRQLKGIFDPDNRMNPGKIIDAPLPWQPDILRYNPAYHTPQAPAQTSFDFNPYSGLGGLVEMCNGQGMCRYLGSGTMCPSFRVTRDEKHSTRGRANALRAAITGELGPEGLTSQELYEVLDLCLECKACKKECSSLVDMARLKSEFLSQYQAKHGIPLRSRLFANISTLYHAASWVPGLSNLLFKNTLVQKLFDRALGIDQRRKLPHFASKTFQGWFKRHVKLVNAPQGPVVLWDDTYLSYNEPEIGVAAVLVLEAAGYEVLLVEDRVCCGRPMISKGLLAEARRNARHNLKRLGPLAARNIPIVGLEPSCTAAFRDEYPALVPGDEARMVAKNTFFIEEFITQRNQQGQFTLSLQRPDQTRHVLVHGHCYQKAINTTSDLQKMLSLLPNTVVDEIPSGCCGMAGSFGYEKEHYEISMACGEERLFPAIRSALPETLLAASGVSCRQQILDGTDRHALHPIQLLAQALTD